MWLSILVPETIGTCRYSLGDDDASRVSNEDRRENIPKDQNDLLGQAQTYILTEEYNLVEVDLKFDMTQAPVRIS
ncbi:unnamed protein product [Ilex paraguariensis]|uniref:Uncharacterized protein n=1 Tax=Ilex paraguariensis TaxID=185542 RepID=A0ABC8S0R9_9AQUA